MVLPFEPLSLAFDEIRYAVDMPQVPSIFNLVAPSMYLAGYLYLNSQVNTMCIISVLFIHNLDFTLIFFSRIS